MSATSDIAVVAEREAAGTGRGSGRGTGRPRVRGRWSSRRVWAVLFAAAVGWSTWHALTAPDVVNAAGWPLVRKFFAAAAQPDLSMDVLQLTARAAWTTVALALLGTLLAVVIGLIGGVLTSETWWAGGRPGDGRTVGWLLGRLAFGLPRGVNEAVWCLCLVNVLGRDPLVGVLALGIPFGAITAKVYAELIDEAAPGAYWALRTAGSGRLVSLVYGVLPQTLPDLVSYAFYRFECSVRSAVILGMIGTGGLGFQLALSFQALEYEQMWTILYALAVISLVSDRCGASLRSRATPHRLRLAVATGGVLTVAAVASLGSDLGRLFSGRTWEKLGDLVGESVPPRLPVNLGELLRSCLATLEMSLLAISMASLLAMLIAFLAARQEGGPIRRATGLLARAILLFLRTIPPPVWALLFLFVLFPGTLPGAVALGIYNLGVLGRLYAEVVENLDPQPAAALRHAGASTSAAFVYATLPMTVTRFAAYSLYRWETAIRETVVVGAVGAGGLGRILEERRAAFDYPGMLTVVISLIVVSLLVDVVSAQLRAALR